MLVRFKNGEEVRCDGQEQVSEVLDANPAAATIHWLGWKESRIDEIVALLPGMNRSELQAVIQQCEQMTSGVVGAHIEDEARSEWTALRSEAADELTRRFVKPI